MEANLDRRVTRMEGLGSTMPCHGLKDSKSGSREDA